MARLGVSGVSGSVQIITGQPVSMMCVLPVRLFTLKCQEITRQRGFPLTLLCVLGLLLALSPSSSYASEPSSVLGPDIPYGLLAEDEQALTFDEAARRLQRIQRTQRDIFAVGYVDGVYWLAFHVPQAAFSQGEQWLRLAPTYIDHLRVYYREAGIDTDWLIREFGDLSPMPRGDLDYRFPVLRLPTPQGGDGYEFIVRLQSTSATLLYATLWDPGSFMNAASLKDTFWGFYFGLAAISTILALYLALAFGGRLLWSIFTFSVSYLVVACIQGYVDWLLPVWGLHLQHYLTSVSVLLAYPALLWLAAECLGLRDHVPRIYAWVTGAAAALSLFIISIPLGLFGHVMTVQAIAYFCTAIALLVIAAYILWVERLKASTLLMAASPLLLMAASVLALSSVFGLINFNADIYLLWQYMLVVNMLLVMGIASSRILQQRRAQQESEQLAYELDIEREARFHQRQFMGMVSHEFRTPLAIMSATLQNLRGGGLEKDQQEVRFQKMERAVDRLTQLTDNCLADARLSANALYVERQPTHLFDLIHSAAAIVSLSDRHELKITIDGQEVGNSEGAGPEIRVDPALMRIALANVMDNAVKYSGRGTVAVECRTGGGGFTLSVSDDGDGVPQSMVPHIFERYRRTVAGASGGEGVGLGLYVARQIVEAHAGRLELAENSERGCRFLFTVPCQD
ncbi:sensor histidine kinase [Hydrocarboniclastica marina]|uniref:histidine kinase n=1 Tax=Hydrocarboniclastica marina TaxID=2259620 RepID=A0A4P7XKC1_9ALTE|nr:sensor histidine kinase [Hydrocarboniclastica marina]QCF27488.1 histidine kinase [Hydrocarboniclastica marina]